MFLVRFKKALGFSDRALLVRLPIDGLRRLRSTRAADPNEHSWRDLARCQAKGD